MEVCDSRRMFQIYVYSLLKGFTGSIARVALAWRDEKRICMIMIASQEFFRPFPVGIAHSYSHSLVLRPLPTYRNRSITRPRRPVRPDQRPTSPPLRIPVPASIASIVRVKFSSAPKTGSKYARSPMNMHTLKGFAMEINKCLGPKI